MTDLLPPPQAGPRPSVDPRFVRRWVDARREEGRRRLRIAVVAAGVLVVALLAVGALYSPLLNVRHVRVSVQGPLSTRSIAGLAGVSTHTRMISVDSTAIAAHLESDPWLGQARVARHWPGTVSISVVVRAPVAAAPGGAGKWAEIDPTGRVLAVIESAPAGLPVLRGLGPVPVPGSWIAASPGPRFGPLTASAQLVDMDATADGADMPSGPAAALALLAALPAPVRSSVQSIDVAAGGGLQLVVASPKRAGATITVLLGDGSHLQAKVGALVTILDQADLTKATRLNLSVPDRPAIVTTTSAGGGP